MKTTIVLGIAAMVGAASIGCGGGDGATGFKQNTGGAGGGTISTGSHPGAGGSSPGAGGSTSSTSSGGSGGCAIFPQDNWWNTNVASADLDPNSDNYIAYINDNGGTGPLHADFDSVGDGIPFNLVDSSVTKVPVTFTYADESDVGPYPIPANPKIEGNGQGDAHLLMIDTSECKLYEIGPAHQSGGAWNANAGAIFDLTGDALRHDCWTSADAAGLPVYPGLVQYGEVMAGEIKHALRFTVNDTQQAWIKPARHEASSDTSADAPPMGLRLRLKSNAHVNGIIAGAGAQPKVVLVALQQYGMLLADNGSNWFVSGEPNAGWSDDDFHGAFGQIGGSDFEVVKSADPIEYHSSPSCN
jgi:hypothetical protein